MNKKAVSMVITTILLILIAFVAVLIVWNVIGGVIKSSTSEIGIEQLTISGKIESFSVNTGQSTALVKITRNTGAEISGVKIIFKDENGITHIYENKNSFPDQLGTKTYSISAAELSIADFSGITEVSFAFLFGENYKSTSVLDTEDKTLAPAECGNNIKEPDEVCDGSDLDGKTCEDLEYTGGELNCETDCLSYDESACTGSMGTIISDCGGELNVEGETYVLNGNIEKNDLTKPCINITAQNIILDCNGYYIKSASDFQGIYSNSSQTTIKNCNISMGQSPNGRGIHLYHADGSIIFNNILEYQRYGITLEYTNHSNISYNLIQGNEYRGLSIESCYYNNISNNNITSNGYHGILMLESDQNKIKNNFIEYNGLGGNYEGIRIASGSDYNLLEGNLIRENTAYGINLNNVYSNNLIGNDVRDNVYHGIYLYNSEYNNISLNNCSYNQNYGIHLSSSHWNNLTDNNASNNLDSGLALISSDNNKLINNIASGNSNEGILLSVSDYTVLVGNTLRSNSRYGISVESSTNNDFQDNVVCDNIANDFACLDSSSNNNLFGNLCATENCDWLSCEICS